MIYQGKAITVKALESGIVELNFDLKGESVNKFNRLTLNELREAVDAIKADASVKGVIVTSGKGVLIAATVGTSRSRPSPRSTASPWAAAWKCAWPRTSA